MSSSPAVLSLGSRVLTGTSLRLVGSFSRVSDFHQAGDPALMKAAVKREASMVATVAAASFGFEHLFANMQGMYKAFPALNKHRSMLQFVPVAAAYVVAEMVSKNVSGLGKQLRHSTANVSTVDASKAKTINLFLKDVNGDDASAAKRTPVKVAELQFAAQPQATANLNNVAQAYYNYPMVSNPFAMTNASAYRAIR